MFRCTVRDPRVDGKTVYYAVATCTELGVYGGAPGAPKRFAALRRYSDFEALAAALSAVAGAGRLPPLPAKNVFAAFGGEKVRLYPLYRLTSGEALTPALTRRRGARRSWRSAGRPLSRLCRT